MTKKTVDSKCKFNIYSSFVLSHDDVVTMSLLYAPLIGSDAFLVYVGFNSLLSRNNLKSEEMTHGDFYDIYSFKPQQFIKARIKLEGIGLLVTYEKENGDLIYNLLPPLTAKNFIKDASLGVYLYSQIGENNFNYIYNHFKIEIFDYKNLKNITSSFDDVFESSLDNNETINKFGYLLGRNKNESINITKYNFDFDKFVKEINTDYLDHGVNKEFEKQIINIAYVYGFSESEMVGLYTESINKYNLYDYSKLKKNCNKLFVYLRNIKAPKLNDKLENDVNYSNDDIISYLENTTAEGILNDIIPDFDPKYLGIINSIYENIDLPRGVLNSMIIKVVKDKGGELPSLAYFKKVSESWISDNVLSTKDAVKYITTFKDNTNNHNDSGYNSGNYDVSGGLNEL